MRLQMKGNDYNDRSSRTVLTPNSSMHLNKKKTLIFQLDADNLQNNIEMLTSLHNFSCILVK